MCLTNWASLPLFISHGEWRHLAFNNVKVQHCGGLYFSHITDTEHSSFMVQVCSYTLHLYTLNSTVFVIQKIKGCSIFGEKHFTFSELDEQRVCGWKQQLIGVAQSSHFTSVKYFVVVVVVGCVDQLLVSSCVSPAAPRRDIFQNARKPRLFNYARWLLCRSNKVLINEFQQRCRQTCTEQS